MTQKLMYVWRMVSLPKRHCTQAFILALSVASPNQPLAQQGVKESLGWVDFHTSCAAIVKSDLNRAVALLHHMTYPVAYTAFEGVTRSDPDCAIAYWGMALTLFQPLWPTRPGARELERGWLLVQEAMTRGTRDPREQGFIKAAHAFFNPSGDPGYWDRIGRWADIHAELYAAFPEDREVRAFYALSHLATASRNESPETHHVRAAEILAGILREEPTHPGAVHYTIHANDFDGREKESLSVVRSYGAIAPRNPHALHMPTHIFVRLGEWQEVIDWNERAATAALAQRIGPSGEFVWDEYPHAIEYLAYAHLQRADDDATRTVIEAIHATRELDPTFKSAFHLASTTARYVMERRDWLGASNLPVRAPDYLPWDHYRWPEAVVWHARGIGAARLGRVEQAGASADRITVLENLASTAGEAIFSVQIHILRLEVGAWQALANGNSVGAVELMREAVRLEEQTPKHPVTPGATIPAREMLGDMYAELGQHGLAVRQYTRSDQRTPGRWNAILGLARSSLALGDSAGATRHYRRLLEVSVSGAVRDGVIEAKQYLVANE